MKLSISEFGKNVWAWVFWSLVFWLLLELGPFVIVGRLFNKTPGELAGPYLAFAMPWAIMAPLVWWLRKWEERAVSPKRVAQGWGLSMALFGITVAAAVFYSGVELRLISRKDAVIFFMVMVLFSVPISYCTLYFRALPRISARSAGKRGDP